MTIDHRGRDPDPGDGHETFTSLFDATYADVLRFVERRAHPSHAEDLVADVYVVVWRRIGELPRDPDEQRAWVYGVARRVLLAGRRGEARRQELAVRVSRDPFGPAGAPPSDFGDPELVAGRVDLARAWERLPARHQEALALTVWEGLDAPRAAVVLGISPVAYRLRLSRARKALRALVGALPRTTSDTADLAVTQRSTS